MQGLITDSGIRHDILEKYADGHPRREVPVLLYVGVVAEGAGIMNLQLQAKLRAVPDVPPGKVPENAQTSG